MRLIDQTKWHSNFYFPVGCRDGFKVPLVYTICSDKKVATYRTILNRLKTERPNLDPAQITVDFELAAIKAAKEVFPTSKIQGCHFHLAKNIVKNLGQHGLKSRYESDARFAHDVRKLMALAFVPVDLVIDTFDDMIATSNTLNVTEQLENANIGEFVNAYFANHYIGKKKKNGQRGKVQFSLDLWNVFDATLNGNFFRRI